MSDDQSSTGVTVFTGTVETMDPLMGTAEVVAIAGDRILDVGPRRLIDRYPTADIVELDGATLLPGFIDAHHHLSLSALSPRLADLSHARSLDEIREALTAQARAEPDTEWIRGEGWEENGRIELTRWDLDDMKLARPVMVAHYTIHRCVVSSAGLDRLGIGPSTPDPPGGRIVRDSTGTPTGVLDETAWSEAQARSLEPYLDPDRWGEHIVRAASQLPALGITAIHDAACPPQAEAVYRQLASEGRLPISVLAMPHPLGLLAEPEPSRLDGPVTGEGDAWFRVGPVKLFADGGAYPWIEAVHRGRERTLGIPFPPIREQASQAARRGFGVAVHAMGNAGLDNALDGIRAAIDSGLDVTPRIEHATLTSPGQETSMADLGVIAVVQPGFVDTVGRNIKDLALEDVTWMAFRRLQEAGVRLAASSDAPSGNSDPMATSQRGVTRLTTAGDPIEPDQRVPLRDWIEAWTRGAGIAGGQEEERGSITAGKRADLVMVEGSVDAPTPPRVVATWVAGRQVYP